MTRVNHIFFEQKYKWPYKARPIFSQHCLLQMARSPCQWCKWSIALNPYHSSWSWELENISPLSLISLFPLYCGHNISALELPSYISSNRPTHRTLPNWHTLWQLLTSKVVKMSARPKAALKPFFSLFQKHSNPYSICIISTLCSNQHATAWPDVLPRQDTLWQKLTCGQSKFLRLLINLCLVILLKSAHSGCWLIVIHP